MVNAVSIYESNLAASGDSKRFHAYLRQKKVNRPTVGPLLVQGSWYDDNRVMANHLADYFSSVFVKEDLSYPQPHQVSNSQFVFKDLTLSEIVKALLILNSLQVVALMNFLTSYLESVLLLYPTLCTIFFLRVFHVWRFHQCGKGLMSCHFLREVFTLVPPTTDLSV